MLCLRQSEKGCVAGESDHRPADLGDLRAGFADVVADVGSDLDHALVHLRLYALAQQLLALADDLGLDVTAQLPRGGIDGHVLFFDPDGEAGPLGHIAFSSSTPGLR